MKVLPGCECWGGCGGFFDFLGWPGSGALAWCVFFFLMFSGVSTPDGEVSFDRAQDRLFVSAKVVKTIDTPSGFIGGEGR